MKLSSTWAVACLAAQAAGAAISHKLDGFTIREHHDPAKRALSQKYVCVMPTRIALALLTMASSRSPGTNTRFSSMARG